MTCVSDECRQGRERCKTPLTCSGFDADQAIAALKLHRVNDLGGGNYYWPREQAEANDLPTPGEVSTWLAWVLWIAAGLLAAALFWVMTV